MKNFYAAINQSRRMETSSRLLYRCIKIYSVIEPIVTVGNSLNIFNKLSCRQNSILDPSNSPTILENMLCRFHKDCINLKVTHIQISYRPISSVGRA